MTSPSLNKMYETKTNITFFEGHSQMCPGETEFLKNIVNNPSIINVIEIGFNAGHSAELFLSSNKNINLVSFDIGIHNYVNIGKKFIDENYPKRHQLIMGNSLITVPEFIKTNKKKFDLIFIDGGHDYNIAKGDLINCKKLSHNKTIIIMDDTMNTPNWINPWNCGPNRVWKEAKEYYLIKELGSKDFSKTHGLSWGLFIIS